jgi:hypothetical protein
MKTKHLLVYRYEVWDVQEGKVRASDTYATLDAIFKGLGTPLMDTAKVVVRSRIYHELVETD